MQKNILALLCTMMFVCACNRDMAYPFPAHPTDNAAAEKKLIFPLPQRKNNIRTTGSMPAGAVLRAGTVSHHMLAAGYIDFWFRKLASSSASTGQCIGTFIIISPRHFGQSFQALSFSSFPWDSGNGIVHSDANLVKGIACALGMKEDPYAFHMEHGIGTLVPFIRQYFPEARIVPILQDDSKLSVSLLRRLADEIIRQMKTNPGIFLVVSTDFSHHRDAVATLAADRRSEEFLENMTSDRFMDAFCDNRGGILVLSLVAEALDSGKSWILAHSTSAEISGVADNDITSYFFSFFH